MEKVMNKYIYSLSFEIKCKDTGDLYHSIYDIYSKDKSSLIEYFKDTFNNFIIDNDMTDKIFKNKFEYFIYITILNPDSNFIDNMSKEEIDYFYKYTLPKITKENMFEYTTLLAGMTGTKEYYDYKGNHMYTFTLTDLTHNPEIYISENDTDIVDMRFQIGDIVKIKNFNEIYKVIWVPLPINKFNNNILNYKNIVSITLYNSESDDIYTYSQDSLILYNEN